MIKGDPIPVLLSSNGLQISGTTCDFDIYTEHEIGKMWLLLDKETCH